jgi:hypothetical protein
MRNDLKEYVPKKKMKALKKRLIRNGKQKGRAASSNDLGPMIQLLYCAFKKNEI